MGATGAVGRVFLDIIQERSVPLSSLKLFATERSAGTSLIVNGETLVVEETSPQSFDGMDIVFISASGDASRKWAHVAVDAGAVVIDDSSAFRMDTDVPLVIPEVNGEDVEWNQGIISIPNCSTTQMVMVLDPLHRVNRISRVLVDTYQSVSGAGRAAMDELTTQVSDVLNRIKPYAGEFPHQIAFNLIPAIEEFLPNGYTKEEQKMRDETRKILHDQTIAISASCVRVPVLVSHSEAMHVEFTEPICPEDAKGILSNCPGIKVVDDPLNDIYPMPLHAEGKDDVFVGRIRQDISVECGLVMYVVSDNLRKGAALNAVQIIEEILRRDCLHR